MAFLETAGLRGAGAGSQDRGSERFPAQEVVFWAANRPVQTAGAITGVFPGVFLKGRGDGGRAGIETP